MKSNDPFENQIRRQTLRPLPPRWQQEILDACAANDTAARPEADPDGSSHWYGVWQRLLVRIPVAWTALAALWIGLAGINCSLPKPFVDVSQGVFLAPRMDMASNDNRSHDRFLDVPVHFQNPSREFDLAGTP